MSKEQLKTAVETALRGVDQAQAAGVLRVLTDFCEAVRDGSDGQVECWLERGYATNLGQQWRAMIAASGGAYRSVMLKAYVPAGGYPLALDLYDEDMTSCANQAELDQVLLAFLGRDATKENLRILAQQRPDSGVIAAVAAPGA